jgi:AcrR family transcriptional regulator
MARKGRRPGESQTRALILQAARQQFADRGYTRTTLRSIANAASVHPALLHHFFGSKQDLFQAALAMPVDPAEALDRLLTETPQDQLADAVVRQFVTTWRDPQLGELMRARARQSFSDPDGLTLMREYWESIVIPRFAHALRVPEANVAAALAHLIGLTLTDSMIRVGQLSSMTTEEIVNLVAPVLDRYLHPDDSPRPPTADQRPGR